MLQTAQVMQQAGFGPEMLANPFGANPLGAFPGEPAVPGSPPQPTLPQGSPAAQGPGTNPSSVPAFGGGNPFGMVDPNMLQQMFGGFGGGPTNLGGTTGGETTANPANQRSPEERFEEQLRQLREMGFVNASQNVRALLATGGNVQMAIEYILGGGGL